MDTEQNIPIVSTSTEELQQRIDALSLGQALVDFEMANARVLDLTARLVEANERVRRFGRESDAARTALQSVSDDRDRIRTNQMAAVNEVAVLARDVGLLREAIAARDARLSELEGEIAARDVQVAHAHAEMTALRNSATFRLSAKLGALKRLLR